MVNILYNYDFLVYITTLSLVEVIILSFTEQKQFIY